MMKIKPDKIFWCILDKCNENLRFGVNKDGSLIDGAITGEVPFQWWFIPLWVTSITFVAWLFGDGDA